METQKKINKKTQTITRLERQLIIQKIKERKQQTRRKIELGGLVIKAGMDQFSKDILLGAFISIRNEIEKDNNLKALYKSIGQSIFMEFT